MRKIVIPLLLIGMAASIAAYYAKHTAINPATEYRQVKIRRGDVAPTISATGTLEAEDFINVGAQVAGLIISFGSDINGKQIDFNSVVDKDMVLANIDPVPYKAAKDQAEATLEKSKADLKQYEAKVVQTGHELKRANALLSQKAIADSDYDTAVLNAATAIANVAVAQATIKANEAALLMAKKNLDYTVIKSPVRGTIIDRRVNIGQTVVASLSAPSICLIAKDLRRMQVWALVNEANIGRIYPNMPVQFTVDAYPKDTFRGKVVQVRMNAQMTSNVVNYLVIVETDNPNGKLFPYMTASVLFEEPKRTNVLIVPNAALRWKPKSAPAAQTNQGKTGELHRLWMVGEGGSPQPIEVDVGSTDGTSTEVFGDKVKEGVHVIVGIQTGNEASEDEQAAGGEDSKSNMPFMPKFPKRGPPKGPGGPPMG
jgi:HlyD family secretion protein